MSLSASQDQLWLECQRKWSFTYQDHIPRGENKSAEFGTLVHSLLEEYYQGRPLPFSSMDEDTAHAAEVAFAILAHLPERHPGLVQEGKFEGVLVGRHEYNGRIDMSDVSTHTVHDFKTTSNFKYVKKDVDLRGDIQAVIYATVMMDRWQVPEINMQWTYGRSRGKPISQVTSLVMTREQLAPLVQELDRISDEIEAARGKRSLDLLPNPEMCEAYGGCPFRHICNLSPKERLHAIMSSSSTTNDLMARLAAAKKTPDAGSTSPQEAPTPPTGIPAPGQINPPEAGNAPPPVKEPKKPRKAKEMSTNPIGTLYWRCQPVDDDYQGFGSLLQNAQFIIEATEFTDAGQAYRVSDYRFVHYGQGPAVLLSAVKQVLAEKRIEALVVRDSPEAQIVLQHLMTMADHVVVGL